jgi:simple sugar transport system permease protein
LRHPVVYPLVGLALILLFNAAFTPGFFAVELRDGRLYGSLVDVLNRSAPVMLLSIGMTLVIATKGVDLSVGAVMAIAGAVAALLVTDKVGFLHVSDSTFLVVAFALLVSAAAGAFNGVLVGKLGVQPIVATLILMVAGRGVAQLLTGGQILIFDNAGFEHLGKGALFGLPMPVVLFVSAFTIVALLVRRTALGLFIEASGSNAAAARLAGVASDRVKVAVYTVSGLMAGIAGVIACADISAADANNAGLYLELDAILAVAVGGTSLAGGRFSLAASAVGAVLMQALTTTIIVRGVSPHATLVAKALIIVAVVLAQSPEFRSAFRRRRAQVH